MVWEVVISCLCTLNAPILLPAVTQERVIWKDLWKLKIAPKIKHFLWKASHDHLPTMSNLQVVVSPFCSRCPTLLETTTHMLFHCKRARKTWQRLLSTMPLPVSPFLSFQEAWSEISKSLNPNDTELVACTCWTLWSDRNSSLQNKQTPEIGPSGLIGTIFLWNY